MPLIGKKGVHYLGQNHLSISQSVHQPIRPPLNDINTMQPSPCRPQYLCTWFIFAVTIGPAVNQNTVDCGLDMAILFLLREFCVKFWQQSIHYKAIAWNNYGYFSTAMFWTNFSDIWMQENTYPKWRLWNFGHFSPLRWAKTDLRRVSIITAP